MHTRTEPEVAVRGAPEVDSVRVGELRRVAARQPVQHDDDLALFDRLPAHVHVGQGDARVVHQAVVADELFDRMLHERRVAHQGVAVLQVCPEIVQREPELCRDRVQPRDPEERGDADPLVHRELALTTVARGREAAQQVVAELIAARGVAGTDR